MANSYPTIEAATTTNLAGPIGICGGSIGGTYQDCVNNCNCVYGQGSSQATTCIGLCKNNPGGISVGADPNAIPGLGGIASAWQTLTSPSTWQRVGLFVFALVILIIGIALLRHQ